MLKKNADHRMSQTVAGNFDETVLYAMIRDGYYEDIGQAAGEMGSQGRR